MVRRRVVSLVSAMRGGAVNAGGSLRLLKSLCDGSDESRQRARRKLERGLMPNEHVVSDAKRTFSVRAVFLDVAGCSDSPCVVNLMMCPCWPGATSLASQILDFFQEETPTRTACRPPLQHRRWVFLRQRDVCGLDADQTSRVTEWNMVRQSGLFTCEWLTSALLGTEGLFFHAEFRSAVRRNDSRLAGTLSRRSCESLWPRSINKECA